MLSPSPGAEHAGHAGCYLETHPAAAGGCGPLIGSLCPAAPGLGPLELFFHLLLTLALLFPDDLERGQVTKGASDWRGLGVLRGVTGTTVGIFLSSVRAQLRQNAGLFGSAF